MAEPEGRAEAVGGARTTEALGGARTTDALSGAADGGVA